MTTNKSQNQPTSQSTPDLNTVFLSVEVNRSSWVAGVFCPATDQDITVHNVETVMRSARTRWL